MPAKAYVSPMSGYLRYSYRDNVQQLVIQSVNNGLPQPTRLFTVRLVSSSGLTPVSPADDTGVSTLTGMMILRVHITDIIVIAL